MKKIVKLSEIKDTLGDLLITTYGPTEDVYIDNLADVQHVNETTLDWVGNNKKNQQVIAEQSPAKVILVSEKVAYTEELKEQKRTLLVVSNPRQALAVIGNAFFLEMGTHEIHPTAIVDPEAKIGKDVYIGPYAVIGKAEVGDNCSISAFVKIYDNVKIGHHCFFKEGAVIGGAGFGFEKDADGNRFRFPQLGKVVIGNYVEVGANSTIDRGALSDTVIGDYTKMDNLCHIAHNNVVGKNCIFTAGSIVSGSCEIGDNTWVGPNSTINNWIKVGADSLIGIGSTVVMKVKDGTKVFGVPAEKVEF
ncbi:hypothetical protein [Prevotella sp. E13-27]|uniref:hypothetical protein n=1 Tax=Prevotella sp. E13-27 TaxID=2938122 RepID=UPI00200AF792|nr:hypothetical protein [Prevotella sp. E13-27]MCK8622339.1 hypothetical protein [Prevotella sp. E13-27]